MASVAGHELGPVLWEDGEHVAYEARDRNGRGRLLVKTTVTAPPDGCGDGDPIHRECALLRTLPASHFPAGLECVEHDARTWGVFPWFGGAPLRAVLRPRQLERDEALAIAERTAHLLDHLHARGAVHGRLAPESILWCRQSRTVRFGDLGLIASVRGDDEPEPLPPSRLAYAAPERLADGSPAADYRCDIYSIGAILYEMLAGHLPFVDADPAELARAHRARPPPRPDPERVPDPLWSVLRRCLEKPVTRRYSGAAGLCHDLAVCRRQLSRTGRLEPFELATADVPPQLLPSNRLYGRDAEFTELMEAYRDTTRGGRAFVLVGGEPGIGKTALVNRLREVSAADGSTFVSGKYPQHRTDQPYAALVEALRALVSPVLSLSAADLDGWRRELDHALGENAAVIGTVLPELGFPPPLPLSPKATRNRFLSTFVSFLQHATRKARPLVLFLDDLQWMDATSEELLAELQDASGLDGLLLIGAYRDGEIEKGGWLDDARNRAQEEGITSITLGPLSASSLQQYLADTLRCSVDRVAPLARRVRPKTASNPLYVARFIDDLHAGGLLRYEPDEQAWCWDERAIAAAPVTENVVDLMRPTLRAYPEDVREALSVMACIGGDVAVDRVAFLLHTSTDDVHRRLRRPAADGVLVRTALPDPSTPPPDDRVRSGTAPRTAAAVEPAARFRFSHDKIEEAVYGLLDSDARDRLHLSIGRALLASGQVNGDDLFLVTRQFDHWLECHPLPDEDRAVAELYVRAGQHARSGNAHDAARRCFESADQLLDDACWETRYELMIRLYRDWAETEYVLGSFDGSRVLVNKALPLCRNDEDETRLIVLLIDQHTAEGDYQEAIILGRSALADLGFEQVMGRAFPKRDVAATLDEELDVAARYPLAEFERRLMSARPPDEPRLSAMMMVLMSLIPPSYFSDRKLNALIATFMARLTYERSFVCESTAKGISNFGNALAEERGMYREGYELARLALRFAEEHYEAMLPRILYSLAGSLNHWVQPLTDSERDIEAGIRLCEKYGERDYNGYLRTLALCQNGIYVGASLASFRRTVHESLAFVQRARNALGEDIAAGVLEAVRELDGTGPAPGDALAPAESRSASARPAAGSDDPDTVLVRCFRAVLRTQSAYLLGDLETARAAVDQALADAHSLSTEMTLPMLNLYSSLVGLETLRLQRKPLAADPDIAERLHENQARMKQWAAGCPENFQHAWLLVDGLRAEIEGRALDAIKAFKAAADSAARNGFRQFEGLAHELLARQWDAVDEASYAGVHRREAARAYRQWGANRVLERFLAEHPDAAQDDGPRESPSTATPTSLNANRGDGLYRETFATAVSALTGSGLLAGAVRTDAIHQLALLGGAEECMVLLPVDGAWRVAARHPAAPEEEEEDEALPEHVRRLVSRAARTAEPARARDDSNGEAPETRPDTADVVAIPVHSRRGVVAVAWLRNPLGALDLSGERLGLMRIAALLAALDTHVNLHTEAMQRLGKLERYLPAHVRDAVLARIDETKPAIQREEMGILFFDLRRFTAYQDSVEAEKLRRLLVQYRHAMGEIIARHEATVDHWEGDGCMVFLADPIPLDLRVRRLVLMATELRTAAMLLVEEWQELGHRLGFGIGAAFGFADCGIMGSEARWDYSASGREVSLASRLCAEAQHGQILVSSEVRAATEARHRFEDIGERTLAGFANPVRIFNLRE